MLKKSHAARMISECANPSRVVTPSATSSMARLGCGIAISLGLDIPVVRSVQLICTVAGNRGPVPFQFLNSGGVNARKSQSTPELRSTSRNSLRMYAPDCCCFRPDNCPRRLAIDVSLRSTVQPNPVSLSKTPSRPPFSAAKLLSTPKSTWTAVLSSSYAVCADLAGGVSKCTSATNTPLPHSSRMRYSAAKTVCRDERSTQHETSTLPDCIVAKFGLTTAYDPSDGRTWRSMNSRNRGISSRTQIRCAGFWPHSISTDPPHLLHSWRL
mmetsp:Transcript_17635/g.42768  ORF Transcript_17635/g.42768 Transcript_17635/m.42768 type:complete len:269 (-) Transcript_17635:6636-7442(-)|eukprot:1670843-Rhodomonas_salina.2